MPDTLGVAERDAFLTIGRCPVIGGIRAGELIGHPCRHLVTIQTDKPLRRHVAEPWIGHIQHAPILFVASNPGYAGPEDPQPWADDDDAFIDMFVNFFGGGRRPYSEDGIHALDESGQRVGSWVRYWAFCRQRARELLGPTVIPGESYAITEVVHCNSPRESPAVWEAANHCVPLYLERVLRLASARVVIVVGDVAASAFAQRGMDPAERSVGPLDLAGRQRMVAFLPHPNRRGGSKSLASAMPDRLAALRAHLSAGSAS